MSFVFFVFHIPVSVIATLREVRLVGGKVQTFSVNWGESSWIGLVELGALGALSELGELDELGELVIWVSSVSWGDLVGVSANWFGVCWVSWLS